MRGTRTPIRTMIAAAAVGIPAIAAGSAMLASSPASANERVLAETTAPELLVVKYHADWCGKCRAMERPLADAKAALAEQPVLFVTFDFTDQTTATQSEYLANVLGYDAMWEQYERRTGFALLVNPETQEIIGELKSADSAAIESAIRENL